MEREQELKDLLKKFSEGLCTEAEERLLRRWLEAAGRQQAAEMLSAADKDRLLAGLRRDERFAERDGGMDIGRYAKAEGNDHAEVDRYRYMEADGDDHAEWAGKWRRVTKVTGRRSLMAAAVAGGIILLSWLLLKEYHFAGKERPFIQMATRGGEVRRFVLPDSSVVWLNAHTQLAYDADFVHHRLVRLNGEAFFEVQTDKVHPFIVSTQDSLETEVLGTQFNIRSYPGLRETSITVLSGKVSVTQPFLHLSMGVLTQRESVHFNQLKHLYTRHSEEDAVALAGWRQGEWELKGQGVAELTLLLFNHYNITVINKRQELDELRLDANFNRQQSAEEIISTFSMLAHCRYRWVSATHLELY